MISTNEQLGTAKSRWHSFCTQVGYAMLAGETAVGYHVSGNTTRALAETRVAIGEAAAVISRALDIRDADATWVTICDAMIDAADIHVAGLESQFSEIQRSARIRTQPSKFEQKQLAMLGIHWSIAILEARTLYASLGGNPDDLTTFSDFYETMKAGDLTVMAPLSVPPWPAMEN